MAGRGGPPHWCGHVASTALGGRATQTQPRVSGAVGPRHRKGRGVLENSPDRSGSVGPSCLVPQGSTSVRSRGSTPPSLAAEPRRGDSSGRPSAPGEEECRASGARRGARGEDRGPRTHTLKQREVGLCGGWGGLCAGATPHHTYLRINTAEERVHKPDVFD